MVDALANYQPKNSDGLFLKLKDGDEVKLRVLTLDPVITVNKYDETKHQFNFVIWNWNLGRAQIWSASPGILNRLTKLHRDDDFPALNKMDIKVVATGEMLERRYEINPLPNAQTLTAENVNAAKEINLEERLDGNLGRLSQHNDDMEDAGDTAPELSGYELAKARAEEIKNRADSKVKVVKDPETVKKALEAFPDNTPPPGDEDMPEDFLL